MADDLLDRAAAALLVLVASRAWHGLSLREIAKAAGIGFAELYECAPSKAAVLAHLSRRFDHNALTATIEGPVKERLFETLMARIEVMEPHRTALLAISRADPLLVLAHLPATSRACLEAAGIPATSPRRAAIGALLLHLYRIWKADDADLGKTMAELDRRLVQLLDVWTCVGDV